MRGRTVLPSVNQKVEQKYSASVGKRFLPLREYMGKDHQGQMIGKAVWHDTYLNRSFDGGDAWEKQPPDLESGDQGRLPSYGPPSERYRQQYGKIDWGQ